MSDGEGDDFVQHKPSLIILHGPPCSGKTRFYKDNYEKTHARFSMSEWLAKGPEATLHGGIKRLAKRLKDGDSMVLDDCNPTEKGRASLISALKKLGADFTLEGIEMRPKGGLLQSRIAAEFALAQDAEYWEIQRLRVTNFVDLSDEESSSSSSDSEDDGEAHGEALDPTNQNDDDSHAQLYRERQKLLNEWGETANKLTYPEGFRLIQFIDQEIYTDLAEFDHAGLLIDAQTLFSFKRIAETFDFDISLTSGVYDAIREWKMATPKGRVIVLIDDATVLPSLVEAEADSPETQTLMISACHAKMLASLKALQCLIPLYYFHIQFGAYDAASFHRVSAEGPISYLLRRHHLNLSQSLWVAPCPKNQRHTVPFGIPYISATEFYRVGGWDLASKLRQFKLDNASLPTWMEHFRTLNSKEDVKINTIDAKIAETVPLEADRRSAFQQAEPSSLDLGWVQVSEEVSFGRVHGCCFPPAGTPSKKRDSNEADLKVAATISPSKRPKLDSAIETIVVHSSSSIPVVEIPSQDTATSEVVIIDSQSSQ